MENPAFPFCARDRLGCFAAVLRPTWKRRRRSLFLQREKFQKVSCFSSISPKEILKSSLVLFCLSNRCLRIPFRFCGNTLSCCYVPSVFTLIAPSSGMERSLFFDAGVGGEMHSFHILFALRVELQVCRFSAHRRCPVEWPVTTPFQPFSCQQVPQSLGMMPPFVDATKPKNSCHRMCTACQGGDNGYLREPN